MSLFNELKRRNVFRVTAAYVVVGWLLLQVGDVVFEALEVDASANRTLMAFVLLGLIPTIIFSWAFEMTPDGIKKDKDVPRNEHQEHKTAKKLDYVSMFVLVLVGAMSLWQHWHKDESVVSADLQAAVQTVLPKGDFAMGAQEIQITDAKSLAVLPFVNMANDPENEPFTLGIHDDLLTHLSKISALKVISRTSVLRYANSKKSIREIAAELGVGSILEGGVQRSGNQIRINVQLIDAKTDKHLWAENFDRELTAKNIFKIQTEISEKIASALKAQLTPEEIVVFETAPTNNMDAYSAYLAGRQRMLLRTSGSLKEALNLFTKATDLDPDYALAYVGRADTLSLLNEYSDLPMETQLTEGRIFIAKALELDPELAEAHTSQANYFRSQGKFKIAETTFKYAMKLNPNYATTYHWYGNLLSGMGKKDEALAMYQKAVELDPLSPVIQLNIGHSLLGKGQIQLAKKQFERVIELDPRFPGAATGIAETYMNSGAMDKAVVWTKKAIDLDPGNLNYRFMLIQIFLNIGDPEAARNELNQLRELAPNHELMIYSQAVMYLYLQQYAAAEQLFIEALKDQPDDQMLKRNFTFYSMVNGHYQAAIDIWMQLNSDSQINEFKPSVEDLDTAINLAWSLKQLGELERSERLIEEIRELLKTVDHYRVRNYLAAVLALENKTKASAEAYAGIFESGDIQNWWKGYHIPYLKEVIQLPAAKLQLQQVEANMEVQRRHLAQTQSDSNQ